MPPVLPQIAARLLPVTTQPGLRIPCADRTKTDRPEASGLARSAWNGRMPFFPLALLFIMIYDFMYILPLILLYIGYNKLQGTAAIRKLERVLDKVSSYIVPVVVSLVGILLGYYGVTSLM